MPWRPQKVPNLTSPKTPSAGGGKRKEPSGPQPPPKASTAYMQSVRDQYKEAHPDMEAKDVTKALKAQWEALDAEAQKVRNM